jgi:NADH dehydrogenase
MPHVVIVGAGFGGLNAAKRLAADQVEVTLIDRDNYHGFWPLLYQVATAGLAPDDIARPVRAVFSGRRNVRFRLGTVTGVDLDGRRVLLDGKESISYDYLILAAGSSATDFGIPGVAEHTIALKTLPDAMHLRNHILSAFEQADSQPSPLTTVLIGGGPTGVELAGALSELIERNLASDFPNLDVSDARIVIVEMADRLLPGFSEGSHREALRTLQAKGVDVRLNTKLTKVTPRGVTLDDSSEIEAATVVWTAGVRANPLAESITSDVGKGRSARVEPDLSLPGHPEVFVIGDMAAVSDARGEQLPMLAQVAIQGGRRAAGNILRLAAGKPTRKFRYRNHGIMATIGRRSAVAELPGGIKLRGTPGWLAWLGVHLVFLIGFRNRVVVLVNWAWNYLTWDRASRVIIEDTP